jgi:hypothetical protein
MNIIKQRLKSKSVMFFVIIFTIYFIEHIINVINYADYEKILNNENESYKIGALSALFLKPIFDLTVLYTVLFKDNLLVRKGDNFL